MIGILMRLVPSFTKFFAPKAVAEYELEQAMAEAQAEEEKRSYCARYDSLNSLRKSGERISGRKIAALLGIVHPRSQRALAAAKRLLRQEYGFRLVPPRNPKLFVVVS